MDPDLRARVRRAGLRVAVVPGVCHFHPMPPTVGSLIRMAFRDGAASATVQRRFPDLAIDTPDTHLPAAPRNVGLPRRIVRAVARLAIAALTLRFFRVLYFSCYACGYLWGRGGSLPPARQA